MMYARAAVTSYTLGVILPRAAWDLIQEAYTLIRSMAGFQYAAVSLETRYP